MSKILIVDDSSMMRKMIRRTIDKIGGYNNILDAEDGLVAFNMIKADPEIKVIFLDVNMPVMSGYELVDKLKETKLIKQVNIIFASTEVANMKDGIIDDPDIAGAIPKPFKKGEFESVVVPILDVAFNNDKNKKVITYKIPDEVLVVDSGLAIRKLIKKELIKLGCENVIEAKDGQDALEVMCDFMETVKLIIIEMEMAHLGGLEFLDRMHLENVEVVLMVSEFDNAESLKSRYPILTDVLVKPFKKTGFLKCLLPILKRLDKNQSHITTPKIDLKTVEGKLISYNFNEDGNNIGLLLINGIEYKFYLRNWDILVKISNEKITELSLNAGNEKKSDDWITGKLLSFDEVTQGKIFISGEKSYQNELKFYTKTGINVTLQYPDNSFIGSYMDWDNPKISEYTTIKTTLELSNSSAKLENGIERVTKEINNQIVNKEKHAEAEVKLNLSIKQNIINIFEPFNEILDSSKKNIDKDAFTLPFIKVNYYLLYILYEEIVKYDGSVVNGILKHEKKEFEDLANMYKSLKRLLGLNSDVILNKVILKEQDSYMGKILRYKYFQTFVENSRLELEDIGKVIQSKKFILQKAVNKLSNEYKQNVKDVQDLEDRRQELKDIINISSLKQDAILNKLKVFTDEHSTKMMQEFRVLAKKYTNEFTIILDKKAFTFEKMLWNKVKESSVLQSSFSSEGYGNNSKTFLKRYIKNNMKKKSIDLLKQLDITYNYFNSSQETNILIIRSVQEKVLEIKELLEQEEKTFKAQGFASISLCLKNPLKVKPRLVIIEYGMREMDTKSFIKNFKRVNNLDSDTAFLIVFNFKSKDLLDAIESGVVNTKTKNYIKDPFKIDELIKKIQEFI